jgi:hypothetical protein
MPAFVVKVTLENGYLLSPITVICANESAAVSLVRGCAIAEGASKVEVNGLRDDVMKIAYGDQSEGTVSIRGDWIWSGETPIAKSN